MKQTIALIALSLTLTASAQEVQIAPVAAVSQRNVPMGAIAGRVSTADGLPASAVTVTIRERNYSTVTNEEGEFYFPDLKPGIYTIEISMVGVKTQVKTVEVLKEQTSDLQIALQENARQLNGVVVSAHRRLNSKPVSVGKIDIAPMDLPQAVTVIGAGLIREQQAQRLSDVVRNVNGVYMTTTRGNVQESFGARGYAFGSTNMFKNGARVNSGAMPEMSGIEKVEVLKGSAAILYGQVAPGGILNMETKTPKFNQGGEVSMRAGSYGLYKPAFDIYGPVTGGIAYRVNGTAEWANSFRDGVSSKRYYVNPSLLFQLGKRTELITEGDYLFHHFTPDFGTGTLNNTIIADVPRNAFFGTPWQYNNTIQSTATATVKHQFNDNWKLMSSVSGQHYRRNYFSVERVAAAANGDWNRQLGRIRTTEKYYTGQVNLNGKVKTGKMEHTILAGIDADRTSTFNNDFSFPAANGFPAGIYDRINILDASKFEARTDKPVSNAIRERNAVVNRYGAYVQDLVKISPRFNLLAGVRWSYVQTEGIDSLNLVNGVRTSGKTRNDQAFSPRVGLVYKPTEHTSVFASYSNSFTVNTGQDINGNTLKPSIIDQYELGVKNELFDGKLSANITAYRIINNNLAQTAPFLLNGTPNNNSSIRELTGQTTSDGVEVDLSAHPVRGLDLMAGYSYNYARYTETANTTGSYKTGERLVNNPAHTANAGASYQFTSGGLKGLRIGANAVYIGDRTAGWNNTVGQAQNFDRRFYLDGFTTVDLMAGYTYKKLGLQAKVSNLTNTMNYYAHENYSINPIAPRQVVGTISYKF